jgi:hypothetical protein
MTIDSMTILGSSGALLGFLGVALALVAIRAARELRDRASMAESSLAGVRRELERLACISVRTDRRVKRVEQESADIAERADQIELRGAPQSIDQAIDYARRGADPGKLTLHFGLSSGEADLVTRLHGRKKRGPEIAA